MVDLADWRRYFGEMPVTDEELIELDGMAMMYADHNSADMLYALRAGRGNLASARAAAVALEQECAVLADTLALLTHEYVPDPQAPGWCRSCVLRADDPDHRTPDWLRKRYGLGL